jgi:DNA-binding transcriptional regulator YiaG
MKKIQCTGCGQIFWTDLQLDESLLSSGEWVQNPCPICEVVWAVVEPGAGAKGTKRGRKAKPGPKRRGRPRIETQVKKERAPFKEEEGTPEMSAKGIRRLRKKLKISQEKFGSLLGVSTATIVSWEKGKFSPRKEKIAQISDLAKKGKEDVEKLLAGKEPKGEREKLTEGSLKEKVKGKGKKRARAGMKVKKAGKAKKVKRIVSRRGKGTKAIEMPEKVGVSPEVVAKDSKEAKKE